MNVPKRTSIANQRVTRTFKVTRTTRAIRAALFGSVVMLGLAGSGIAYAGTCAADDPGATNTIACNGTFTGSIPGLYDPLVDLTLVIGGSQPTSVIPTAGMAGVGITSLANVDVLTHADIATSGADGVHIDANSVTLDNDGTISTEVTVEGVSAIGVSAIGDITIANNGELGAFSSADEMAATAVTVTSTSDFGDVTFDNLADGIITADSSGYSSAANGISITTSGGSAVVNNFGSIEANATSDSLPFNADGTDFTHDASSATGVLIHSGGDATLFNSGSISATGQSQSINYSRVAGVAAYSVDGTGTVTITNAESGTIASTAGLVAFGAIADYIEAGTTGTINNAGSISAEAMGMGKPDGYTAFTTSVAIGGFAANINNTGEITAIAHGDAGNSRGVWGSQSLDNSGTIFSDASDGTNGTAMGAFLQAVYAGDASISNSGSIVTTAGGSMVGISALVIGGDLSIENSGSLNNIAAPVANGIWNSIGIGGNVRGQGTFVNSGDIALECGGNQCNAMDLRVGSDMVVENSGTMSLTGTFYQSAIVAVEFGGTGVITNSGSISVNSTAGLYGVNGIIAGNLDNYASDDRTTTIVNSGSISAVIDAPAGASYLPLRGQVAIGVSALSESGAIDITNSGSLTAQSYSYSALAGGALGINASSQAGDIAVSNSGSISALSETSSVYEGGFGAGMVSYSGFGSVALTNSGSITVGSISNYASDNGQTVGEGIGGFSVHGDVAISNSAAGVVNVEASALLYNTAAAYGAYAQTTDGGISIANDGHISAIARGLSGSYLNSYGQTTAVGIGAVNLFGKDTSISNNGAISAAASTAIYGAAHAIGISAYASSPYAATAVSNSGTISATANAEDHSDIYDSATASGMAIANRYGGTTVVGNSGVVTSTATSVLSSRAVGVSFDGTSLAFDSSGSISAIATADGAVGTALATGLAATGGALSVALEAGSTVAASASGYDGTAIGLLVAGDVTSASNVGTVDAAFTGGIAGRSYGALLVGSGDLAFTNTGAITAAGSGQAVGVALSSDASTHLINGGSVTATSAAGQAVAFLTGDSADTLSNSGTVMGAIVLAAGDDVIDNSGTITGQLMLGDGNDRFDNLADGVWNASGASDLGTGDDALVNAGILHLHGATISFGTSGSLGNLFDNAGLVTLTGINTFDVGSASADLFRNTGLLDMRNGMATDALAVNGNFAGGGQLNVDLVDGQADQLRIDGDVAGGITTINVAIGGTTVAIPLDVPVVRVSGDSNAGDFVIGTVNYAPEALLALGFTLNSDIDASNGRDDVFSLALEVAGLTDPATLAASLGAGAQGLMSSQVGSWRQRMGVINSIVRGRFGVWARLFKDDGVVDPNHAAGNFGQRGNFAYDQDNSGTEVGIDLGINEQISAGLLLARADSSQRLTAVGAGSNRIEGDTVGVYATWISPSGFYLDASYRRMGFDAKVRSVAGEGRTEGDASAVNVELGYGWTFGDNLTLQPQLQYTRTDVDGMDDFSGALEGFHAAGGVSSRGRLGLLLGKSFSARELTWSPYASLSVVREFDGEQGYRIEGDQAIPAAGAFFGSTSGKGTSTRMEAGLNVQAGAWSLFGGANRQDGGAYDSVVGAQLGARLAW